MNHSVIFIISLIICTTLLVVLSLNQESKINTQEPKSDNSMEIKEQKEFDAKQLEALSQIRQTKLNLTIDKAINPSQIFHDDYSDEQASINKGIAISDQYNQASYDYSAEKISSNEYLSILKQLKIKYSTYLMDISNHSWNQDISEHKQFLTNEYQEIVKEIKILEN